MFVFDRIETWWKKMLEFTSQTIENSVGKGENADYQRFYFSHNISKKLFSLGHYISENF